VDEWLVILSGYVRYGPRFCLFDDFEEAKAWAFSCRQTFGCAADVISMKGMEEALLERESSSP
jgi:hypothetical protein